MFKTWVTPVPTGGMSKNSALLGILCYCIYKYCEEHVDGCPMWLIKAIKCNAIYCNPLNYSHCTLCGYIGLCAFSLCWGTVSADIHQSSTSPPVCTDELHNKKKRKSNPWNHLQSIWTELSTTLWITNRMCNDNTSVSCIISFLTSVFIDSP